MKDYGFPFRITKSLLKTAQKSRAIKRQFYPTPAENYLSAGRFDPFEEKKHSPIKGVIHRYSERILIILSNICAANCRFCTRKYLFQKNEKPLTKSDLEKIIIYLKSKPKVNEVIFSGGDPLMTPQLLMIALEKITFLPQIKILRIHTRVPVAEPDLITEDFLSFISKMEKPLYISLHFEHPDELTPECQKTIFQLRKSGAILLSQTVFLKGINDNYNDLFVLFKRLSELGVRPYSLFRCDPVAGVKHFIVPLEKEIVIATKLRKNLSGIACPLYVIDTPQGTGKIPVPLSFWQANLNEFSDFDGKKIKL